MGQVKGQHKANGVKNGEARTKLRRTQVSEPSRQPRRHPKVFVAGDATSVVFSHLTAPDDSEHPTSKTNHEALVLGAQFMRDVLHRLCGDKLAVEKTRLIQDGNSGGCRAILKQFGDRHRIHKYLDGDGDLKSKAQCLPASLRAAKGRGALVIHGLPDCRHLEPRAHPCLTAATRDAIQPFLAAAQNSDFRIVLNLNELPPWQGESADRKSGKRGSEASPNILGQLRRSARERVAIVTSLGAIRRSGALVNDRSSWEQTVEDLAAELYLFKRLQDLRDFGHLFIRMGTDGLVHIRNRSNRISGRLYFAANWDQGSHVRATQGTVAGMNTLVIASVLKALLRTGDEEGPLQAAIIGALRAIRATHAAGYRLVEGETADHRGKALVESFVETAKSALPDTDSARSSDHFVSVEIPADVFAEPPGDALSSGKRWRILDEVLTQTPPHRVNVALAIAKAGHRQVMNRRWEPHSTTDRSSKIWETLARVEFHEPHDRGPDWLTLEIGDYQAVPDRHRPRPVPRPIDGHKLGIPFSLNVPILNFGKLTVADRDEIESLNSVANLFRNYVQKGDPAARPLSIAVFGPPGSGKTFAVKEIQRDIDPDHKVEFMEFNVAQMRSVEDLEVALNRVGSASHGRTPLAFFDEFDCAFHSRELGWLQYFLAPMQDGSFYAMNHTIEIGRAIFVFAGGIHESFATFDPRYPVPDEHLGEQARLDYEQQVKEFADRKGPDFISRLRGHLDILGTNEATGKQKRLVQRALQLRGLFRTQKLADGEDGLAAVRDEVIYALLTVDRYHHGVRSMDAILRMCTHCDGQFSGASLPSRAQLNMHVDAEDFLRRVHRGRVRVQDPAHSFRYHHGADASGSKRSQRVKQPGGGYAATQKPMIAPTLSSSG